MVGRTSFQLGLDTMGRPLTARLLCSPVRPRAARASSSIPHPSKVASRRIAFRIPQDNKRSLCPCGSALLSRFLSRRTGGALLAATPLVVETTVHGQQPDPNPIIGFLADIILASPLPSFALTIILLTVITRSGITLPITLWQRDRAKKSRAVVEPLVREYNRKVAKELVAECRKKGMSFEEYKKEVKKTVAVYQANLHRKHKTHPTITMIAPLAVHIPLMILLSLSIRQAIEAPGSTIGMESLLWIDHLTDKDNYLPFIGAGIAAVNAEVMVRKAANAASAQSGAAPNAPISTSVGPSEVTRPPTSSRTSPSLQQSNRSTITTPPNALSGSGLSAPTSSPPTLPSAPPRTMRSTPPTPPHPSRPSPTPTSPRLSPSPPSRRPSSPKRSISTTSPAAGVSRTPVPPPTKITPEPTPPTPNNEPSLEDADGSSAVISPESQAQIRASFFSGLMRFSAIIFIPIASQVPAGLAFYWVTSMIYTTVQNTVLDYLQKQEKLKAPSSS